MYHLRDINMSSTSAIPTSQCPRPPRLTTVEDATLSSLSEVSAAAISNLFPGKCNGESRVHGIDPFFDCMPLLQGCLSTCLRLLLHLAALRASTRVDTDSLLKPVVELGTTNVLRGLRHEPGGLPMAYHLVNGEPRVWICIVSSSILKVRSKCTLLSAVASHSV